MWFNPIMEWLLKSPFHSLISKNTMILYYTGCKSGKAYHTPVGYQRVNNTLLTTSWKDRTWWKNFREGCDVKILLEGRLEAGHSQVYEDDAAVAEGLTQYIAANPQAARMFQVEMSENGQPENGSLQKAARVRVFIRTTFK